MPRKKEDGTKLTKAQRKKLKKKRRKEEKKNVSDSGVDTENDKSTDDDTQQLKVDIDYIAEEPDLDPVTMQFNKEPGINPKNNRTYTYSVNLKTSFYNSDYL